MKVTPKKLADNFNFKLTELREDILKIIIRNKKPQTAYQILDQLKAIRENPKPPTVYRVLEFFVKQCVVHRILCDNSYALCQIQQHNHSSSEIVVVCHHCHRITEFTDPKINARLTALANQHNISIDSHLIELPGTCQRCQSNTKNAVTS